MKHKKVISILVILFLVIWNFSYFLGYLQKGFISFIVLQNSILCWLLLAAIASYQVFKFIVSKKKDLQRLLYASLILIICLLSYLNPRGLINWKKFEGKSLMIASREGVANCQTYFELKENYNMKYTSACLGGMNFIHGTYRLSNDTVYMQMEYNAPYMAKESYAILHKSNEASNSFTHLSLFKGIDNQRTIMLKIHEINMDELLNWW